MQKKMIFDISGSSKFESVISSLDIKTIVQCEYFAIALHTSHINHFLMKLRFYIRICYSSLVHVRLRHYMSLHVSWTWHVTVHMFSSMWGMSGMHDYYISEFKSCFGSTVSSQYNLKKHWTLDPGPHANWYSLSIPSSIPRHQTACRRAAGRGWPGCWRHCSPRSAGRGRPPRPRDRQLCGQRATTETVRTNVHPPPPLPVPFLKSWFYILLSRIHLDWGWYRQ